MGTRQFSIFATAFCMMLMQQAARADFSTTIGASKDNTIFSNSVDNSNGGGAGIFAGTNGSGAPCRGLLEFDIGASVPAGSTITSVELRLYLGMAPNTNPQSIELHKLAKDWGEGTAGSSNPSIMTSGMGYPAGDGDTTWNQAEFGSVSWSAPGANGDFSLTASAAATVGGPSDTSFIWGSTSAMVGDVQNWLDVPSSNFGWALVNADEVSVRTQKVFYSRQATQNSSGVPNSLDLSWRPTLTVNYTTSLATTGDYNRNGVIDSADYVVWRKTLNESVSPAGSGADGNQNGLIDSGDYIYWRSRFGNAASGFANGNSVPEPASSMLILFATPLAFLLRRG